jgi:hypothetical protein
MDLVKKEVSVPKELNEVGVFIVELLKDIKAKKGVTLIIGENLTNLMTAVEGFDKLGDEVKSVESYDFYALLASDIAKALKG